MYNEILPLSEKLALVGQYLDDHKYKVEKSTLEGYIRVYKDEIRIALIGDMADSLVVIIGNGVKSFNLAGPNSLAQIAEHLDDLINENQTTPRECWR